MGVYKRGRIWWLAYTWESHKINESARTSNKRLAERILEKRKGEIVEGRFQLCTKNQSPTILDWSKSFLASLSHPNTKRRYQTSVTHLISAFGKLRLSEITPDSIERFRADRLTKAGPATANRDLAVLRRMMRIAVRRQKLNVNPIEHVDFCNEKQVRRRAKLLSFQEESAIFNVASQQIRTLLTLLVETGLRVKCEALCLRWEDVDLQNGNLYVRASKTPSGERLVPLSERCLKALLFWREHTVAAGSAWVFPSPRDSTKHLREPRRDWILALKAACIPYRRIYDLRATFASRMLAAGESPLFIAYLLGHSSTSILPIYARLADEYRRGAILKLEQFRLAHESPERKELPVQ